MTGPTCNAIGGRVATVLENAIQTAMCVQWEWSNLGVKFSICLSEDCQAHDSVSYNNIR